MNIGFCPLHLGKKFKYLLVNFGNCNSKTYQNIY